MTEENKTATPQAANPENMPTLVLQKVYTKDASFEAPNAPDVFNEKGQPEIKMNLNQKVKELAPDAYEVLLTITVTCEVNGKNAYLAEVQQAGIFGMKNFDDRAKHQTLGTYCPNTLFPFARQAVTELVLNGGFQPLLLQPVNFDQLYFQQMQQAQAQAQAQSEADNSTKQ